MQQRSNPLACSRQPTRLGSEQLESRYLLSGVADGGSGSQSGDAQSVIIAELGSSSSGTVVGVLTNDVAQHTHNVGVVTTEPHLFELAVLPETAGVSVAVEATIYDANGNTILSLTASTSGSGSGSVILQPGSYSVVVASTSSGPNAVYELQWQGESQYLGPPVIDPSGSPIGPCGDTLDEFCFPDTTISSDVYIWVDDELEPAPDGSEPESSWAEDFWWDWYVSLIEPLVSGS